ncbi:hypothetical protein BP6252_05082 [Coleophoma cylindrospora]|uniref:Pentacotripeptide-repeat region of PRORP domain-containing protein n=1 Tax=Coleophoma cylindrospora TaxID=1849047 RepID=A0A3D8RSK5_9HELO|nr:hypothetical protein BP6252_05082 [Coleophoma cylindrospora]
MPSSLPVPSKGALRTLRNLALGTSCTVSFTAGLLTEDRRRRIHAAREVHENAKRIKSSRSYHSAGAAPIVDRFEDQIRINQEDGPLLLGRKQTSRPERLASEKCALEPAIGDIQSDPSRREQSLDSRPSAERSKDPVPKAAPQVKLQWQVQTRRVNSKDPRGYNPDWHPIQQRTTLAFVSDPFHGTSAAARRQEPTKEDIKQFSIRGKGRQIRLASDVKNLLNGATDVVDVDAAASRFLDAFDDGFEIGYSGVSSSLMNAAIDLSAACLCHSRLQAVEKILLLMLEFGPIDEAFYSLLNPLKVIENLMQGPLDDHQWIQVEPDNIQKAAKIFLAEFKERPQKLSEHGMALGVELCAQTYRAGMTKTTVKLYGRLQAVRGDSNRHLQALKYNILAEHHNGKHKYVVDHFSRWFKHTMPNQSDFASVSSAALESALVQSRFDRAEKVVVVASEIAIANKLVVSTTWFLRLLGGFWRSSKDIESTRALFDRLEACLKLVPRPVAAYSAIIQFCVESGDETTARAYQARLESNYGRQETDIRTCGHFALAKAMRGEWQGVEDDFEFMSKSLTEATIPTYSKVFVPILMEYIRTHSLDEIENFLQLFTQQYKVPLHVFMSNAMVDAYAQARELGSMLRWLQYAAATTSTVDAVTFNIMLDNCHKTWGFKFDELYHLFDSVQSMQQHNGESLVDSTTVAILRNVAMTEYKREKDSGALRRALKLLKKIPVSATAEYSVDSHEIGNSMRLALSKGDSTTALQIYGKALKHHVYLHASVIGTATQASLQIHGRDFTPTAKLLAEARENRYDITIALGSVFVYEMTQRTKQPGLEAVDVTSIVRSMRSTLSDQQHILPAAVTHAANILVSRGLHQEALDLWTTVTRQQSGSRSFIDIVSLTVLVQAYIGLRDSSGVNWVIKTMKENELIPDKMFKTYLLNARQKTLRYMDKNLLYLDEHEMIQLQQFHKTLDQAFKTAAEMKKDATKLKSNVRLETIRIMQEAVRVQKGDTELNFEEVVASDDEEVHKSRNAHDALRLWEDEVQSAWPQAAVAEGG